MSSTSTWSSRPRRTAGATSTGSATPPAWSSRRSCARWWNWREASISWNGSTASSPASSWTARTTRCSWWWCCGRSRATAQLVLKRGGDRRLRAGHPWVYRGEVADIRGQWVPGDVVDVLDAAGHPVGRGYYNPRPGIACRVLAGPGEAVDTALIRHRLAAALAYRLGAGLVSGD